VLMVLILISMFFTSDSEKESQGGMLI